MNSLKKSMELNYYYGVLEVPHNASRDEIKKAWRKLAIRFHPDRNSAPDTAEKFREITDAYEFLCNLTPESIQSDFTASVEPDFTASVEPGKVRIGTPDQYSNVKLMYENKTYYGTLRSSQNNRFSVFFKDSDFGSLGALSQWINGHIFPH